MFDINGGYFCGWQELQVEDSDGRNFSYSIWVRYEFGFDKASTLNTSN